MLRASVIAAAAAIIAVFVGAMYLRFSGDDNGRPVVVAARDIAAGTRITEEMVKVVEVPDSKVVAGAHSDTAPAVGQMTKVALASGEQVTASTASCGSVTVFGGPKGPVGSVMATLLSLNTCNKPDASTAKAAPTTLEAAQEMVRERGGSISYPYEPVGNDSSLWLIEVRGTFVDFPPNWALVPGPPDAHQTELDTATAGTLFAIVACQPVPVAARGHGPDVFC